MKNLKVDFSRGQTCLAQDELVFAQKKLIKEQVWRMFAIFDCFEKVWESGNGLETGTKDEGCHVFQKERKMS